MKKILVIGSANADLVIHSKKLPALGETVIGGGFSVGAGGKGLNQAVAAKRMGAEVSFLCAIGDDENGKKSIAAARENGINAYFKIKKGKATPFAFILTDKNGENLVGQSFPLVC